MFQTKKLLWPGLLGVRSPKINVESGRTTCLSRCSDTFGGYEIACESEGKSPQEFRTWFKRFPFRESQKRPPGVPSLLAAHDPAPVGSKAVIGPRALPASQVSPVPLPPVAHPACGRQGWGGAHFPRQVAVKSPFTLDCTPGLPRKGKREGKENGLLSPRKNLRALSTAVLTWQLWDPALNTQLTRIRA